MATINSVTRKAASTASSPATYPLGVQWYCPFEPRTATAMLNCMTFKNKGGFSHAV